MVAYAASVSTGVAATVGVGVVASVTASVAGSVGASVGGAAGGGGGVLPMLMGAQRFACTSGVAVKPSEEQRSVSEGLSDSWIMGQVDVLSMVPSLGASIASRRHLQVLLTPECARLLNTIFSAALGFVLMCCLHCFLVCLWRYVVNRRYYQKRRTKFFPYPKSLVWPTPLFFICCVFVTGLTRSSVRLIAMHITGTLAEPNDAARTVCVSVAIGTLVVVVSLPLIVAIDLARFHPRRKRANIEWKPGAKAGKPTDIADPMMRLRARLTLTIVARCMQLRNWMGRPCTVMPTTAVDPAIKYEVSPPVSTTAKAPRLTAVVTMTQKHGPVVKLREVTQRKLAQERRDALAINTLAKARSASEALCARRGMRDRKIGAFGGVPEADIAEPARTERLLAHPFALRHQRIGDQMQAREGFLLFRVNGTRRINTYYRLIVITANILFGVLSGIGPLLAPYQPLAIAQTAVVMLLQLSMSVLCCTFSPDADRVVSSFAGFQFFMEGTSTAILLAATIRVALASSPDVAHFALTHSLLLSSFWFGLLAIGVPMTQLLEQRFMTPLVLLWRNKGKGNKLALLASAYMLATSLPLLIMRLITTSAGLAQVGVGQLGAAAGTADAGDEVGNETEAAPNQQVKLGLGGGDAAYVGAKVSKLLARGVAAKEATAKELKADPHADAAKQAAKQQPLAGNATYDGTLQDHHHWRNPTSTKNFAANAAEADDEQDEADMEVIDA